MAKAITQMVYYKLNTQGKRWLKENHPDWVQDGPVFAWALPRKKGSPADLVLPGKGKQRWIMASKFKIAEEFVELAGEYRPAEVVMLVDYMKKKGMLK